MKELVKKFIPSFLTSWYHFLLAFFGAVLYRFPSNNLKVIGVTGTGGKSTVVELAAKVLEEKGYKVASISSIRFKIGNKDWKNELKMTMPGRLKLQRFLRKAKNSGCQYVVLEVTSEGIKQHRHRFIDFDVAVFTNLSPEHIESHKGFENYREAKLKLFKKTKNIHIINLDDENAKYFLEILAEERWGYEIKIKNLRQESRVIGQKSKILEAENITIELSGVNFEVRGVSFHLNLLGKFNIYNALAAVCVGLSQGISLENCRSALEKIKGIPGRMEIVIKKSFTVIVDYAQTPESLNKVYETVKCSMFHVPCSVICVLGACGGGRDKWKRPVLGKLAAEYCQEIIVTNEDPYNENPMEIIEQVVKGTKGKAKKILDRREAIRKALKIAKNNDVVIITGKGCEPWMCVEKGKKITWDDRKIVREEFQKIYEKV